MDNIPTISTPKPQISSFHHQEGFRPVTTGTFFTPRSFKSSVSSGSEISRISNLSSTSGVSNETYNSQTEVSSTNISSFVNPIPFEITSPESISVAEAQKLHSAGLSYYKPSKGPPDYPKALSCFVQSASHVPESFLYLAFCVQDGKGCHPQPNLAFRYFKLAAQAGVPLAQLNLGVCYERGIGDFSKPDFQQAAFWYKKAAEAKNHHAHLYLGYLYHSGLGVSKDHSKAFKHFSIASHSLSEALYQLSLYFKNGHGDILPDSNMAFQYLKEAADHPNPFPSAANDLGLYYRSLAIKSKSDPSQYFSNAKMALQYFTIASQKGLPKALSNLGNCYEKGFGVPVDTHRAFELYLEAAKKFDSQGMFHLGFCYITGTGVKLDVKEGLRWYVKSASRNNPDALNNLAELYQAGQYVEKNPAKSVQLLWKAVKSGHATASYNMGLLLTVGIPNIIPQDNRKAFNLFKQAAHAGCPHALVEIGLCYANGRGVAMNHSKAFFYFNQAAKSGLASGYLNLGVCYTKGIGTIVNIDKAEECYRYAVGLSPSTSSYLQLFLKKYRPVTQINHNIS